MGAKRFEELEVWQKARKLCVLVNDILDIESFKRNYALTNQLGRSSISIVSNIAEGYERNGNKEFINFLSMAKGSAGELRTQLYIANDLGYIPEIQFKELHERTIEISKMLSSLINYLKQSEFRGTKYAGEPEPEYKSDFDSQSLNLEL